MLARNASLVSWSVRLSFDSTCPLSWLAAIIGLRTRKQTTALIWSLGSIFTWALLPMFVAVGLFEAIGVRPGDGAAVFLLASPLPFFVLNELFEVHQVLPRNMPIVLLFAINTAIYGAALLGLRWLCLSQLDWLMKRSDSGSVTSEGQL